MGEAAQQGGGGVGMMHGQFIQPRQMGARNFDMLLCGGVKRKVPDVDLFRQRGTIRVWTERPSKLRRG